MLMKRDRNALRHQKAPAGEAERGRREKECEGREKESAHEKMKDERESETCIINRQI